MTEIDELIREIAAKHGIAVGRDDPILILQTLNKRLLENGAKAQEEMLNRFKEEIEALSKRWGDDAKSKAERVLNAALSANQKVMETTGREEMAGLVQSVKAEIEASLARTRKPLRSVQLTAILNIVAAAITLAAAFLVLWAR
jgi:hypothetical protein